VSSISFEVEDEDLWDGVGFGNRDTRSVTTDRSSVSRWVISSSATRSSSSLLPHFPTNAVYSSESSSRTSRDSAGSSSTTSRARHRGSGTTHTTSHPSRATLPTSRTSISSSPSARLSSPTSSSWESSPLTRTSPSLPRRDYTDDGHVAVDGTSLNPSTTS
jgi:hypothetical protein